MREKPNRTCPRCVPVVAMLLALFASANPGLAQTIDPELYGSLEYRHIGPPGNRLAATDIPIPVVQQRIPRDFSPETTAVATRFA